MPSPGIDFFNSIGRFLPHALQHHGELPQAFAERLDPTPWFCLSYVDGFV